MHGWMKIMKQKVNLAMIRKLWNITTYTKGPFLS